MEEGKDDAMERGRDGVMEGGRDGVIERREGVMEEGRKSVMRERWCGEGREGRCLQAQGFGLVYQTLSLCGWANYCSDEVRLPATVIQQ